MLSLQISYNGVYRFGCGYTSLRYYRFLYTFFQGTVTAVNTTFACFILDSTIKVHMGIALAQGKIKKLPLIGSKILIKDGHKFNSTYVACESSIIMEGNFQTECPWNSFLNLINTFKLGPDDIIKFEEISNEIEKKFTNLVIELKNEILLSLLQKLISLIIDKEHKTLKKGNYNNRIIYKVSLTTVSACRYVEINSNKYAAFPYWSFGLHPSEKNKMLFGYLEIHPVYGFYMVNDNEYNLVCVVITADCKKTVTEISQLQNSYILIEKYIVITEVFREIEVPNVEYIIAKVDDIHVIHSRNGSSIFGMKSDKMEFPNVISFKLLKKSTVCIGISNLQELLLEVSIKFSSTGLISEDVYLVLSSKYIRLNLQLKEELSYMMYYKTSMKIIQKPELTKIKNIKIYQMPHEDCFFQPVSDGTNDISEPLSILKCKSHIENNRDMVTFRGVIKVKKFTDSVPSRTLEIPAVYGFGTPGKKVHQIVFSYVDNNCTMFLDCYLNNWENMLMPLGLVPEMEVIVRHVIPQSKKYLRSTIFTSFEVVSYKPSLNFSTVNLYRNNNIDWGVPIYLSQGKNIPVDVLIWGQVFNIFVLKLSFSSQCIQCKQIINNPNHSNSCGRTESEIKFEANFNVMDQFGQSSVTTKSLNVLQELLNCNKNDFKEWVAIFHYIGSYSYNYFDESTAVFEDFTTFLKKISERKIWLDLKCRKMADSSSEANEKPAWYCIKARRC